MFINNVQHHQQSFNFEYSKMKLQQHHNVGNDVTEVLLGRCWKKLFY
jgi:hypothetical protein